MCAVLRVLLADDRAMLREALGAIIDREPDMQMVGAVADGQAAVEAAHLLLPDVLVTDLSMPVLGGIGATARLRADGLATRVVAWTAHREWAFVTAVEQAGGHGYVLKHSPVEVLLEAIRVVATGSPFRDPALAKPPSSFPLDVLPVPDSSPNLLSAEECLVLQHTARGQTSQDIATTLGISPSTIVELRSHAMASLGLANRVALVRYALRQGWLDASQD